MELHIEGANQSTEQKARGKHLPGGWSWAPRSGLAGDGGTAWVGCSLGKAGRAGQCPRCPPISCCSPPTATLSNHHHPFTPPASIPGLLNLIDLAGSERLSRSAVTGDRLKETQVGLGGGWVGRRPVELSVTDSR